MSANRRVYRIINIKYVDNILGVVSAIFAMFALWRQDFGTFMANVLVVLIVTGAFDPEST